MVRRFGVAPRQSLLLPYTPVVDGRKPVITEARDGLHADDEQYARVNNVPLFAKRVIFGSLIGADINNLINKMSIMLKKPSKKGMCGHHKISINNSKPAIKFVSDLMAKKLIIDAIKSQTLSVIH